MSSLLRRSLAVGAAVGAAGFAAWRLLPGSPAGTLPEAAQSTGKAFRASSEGQAVLARHAAELRASLASESRPRLSPGEAASPEALVRVVDWVRLTAMEEHFTDDDARWLIGGISNPALTSGEQFVLSVALLDALSPRHPDGRTPPKLLPQTEALVYRQVERHATSGEPVRRQGILGSVMFYGFYLDGRYARLVRSQAGDPNEAVAAYARHCLSKAKDFPKEP